MKYLTKYGSTPELQIEKITKWSKFRGGEIKYIIENYRNILVRRYAIFNTLAYWSLDHCFTSEILAYWIRDWLKPILVHEYEQKHTIWCHKSSRRSSWNDLWNKRNRQNPPPADFKSGPGITSYICEILYAGNAMECRNNVGRIDSISSINFQ